MYREYRTFLDLIQIHLQIVPSFFLHHSQDGQCLLDLVDVAPCIVLSLFRTHLRLQTRHLLLEMAWLRHHHITNPVAINNKFLFQSCLKFFVQIYSSDQLHSWYHDVNICYSPTLPSSEHDRKMNSASQSVANGGVKPISAEPKRKIETLVRVGHKVPCYLSVWTAGATRFELVRVS